MWCGKIYFKYLLQINIRDVLRRLYFKKPLRIMGKIWGEDSRKVDVTLLAESHHSIVKLLGFLTWLVFWTGAWQKKIQRRSISQSHRTILTALQRTRRPSISMRILLSQICSLGFAATVSYGSRQCLALFSVLCYARRKRLEAKNRCTI